MREAQRKERKRANGGDPTVPIAGANADAVATAALGACIDFNDRIAAPATVASDAA